MKKTIGLASLLTLMCLLIPAVVWADAVVSIEPGEVQSPVAGETLEFDLVITGAENVSGFQASVAYDTTALNYVSAVEGDFLKSVGSTFWNPPKVEDGKVTLVSLLIGAGVSGDGTLATASFEVVSAKESTLELTGVQISDPDGNEIPAETEDAIVTVEVEREPVITEHEADSKVLTLEGVYPTDNEHGHCYIAIWTGEFAISEGMFLEYQIAMSPANTTTQASIDLHASDGTTLRDSGSVDQNGLNAHPATDLSGYTGNFDDTAEGDWYHRKISLDALTGKTIDYIVFAMDSSEHSAGLFRAYADNVQISDDEGRLLDVYIDEEVIQSSGTAEVSSACTEGSCGGVVGVEDYKVYVSVGDVAVEPAGKLSTTWGTIKSK